MRQCQGPDLHGLTGHLITIKQVTTEAASPGTLTRMDVVEPPYMAP